MKVKEVAKKFFDTNFPNVKRNLCHSYEICLSKKEFVEECRISNICYNDLASDIVLEIILRETCLNYRMTK